MENKTTWKATVWGVRGDSPMPDAGYLRYGGNTSCISVDCGGRIIVFDAGSGLRKLGEKLTLEGQKKVHILLSHFHIDHCIGLFSFPLFHDPQAEIHLYGDVSCRKKLELLVGAPFWPYALRDFQAQIHFHEVRPGDFFLLDGDSAGPGIPSIRTLRGSHPNRSLLYRLEEGEKSVIYALDCELKDDLLPALISFCRQGSLVVWDASFTEDALDRHKGEGHSCWSQGIEIRRKAEAVHMLMSHYSPEYNDAMLQAQEYLLRAADPESCFAKEGMEIQI